MHTRATLLLSTVPLLFLSVAPAPKGVPAPLGYHPAEGRSFERSFRETTSFEVESVVRTIGETELPGPALSLAGELSRELEVVDTIARVGEGRPEELRRRFTTVEGAIELQAELEGDEEDYEADLESPLEDRTVSFSWDEDEEGWRAAAADGADDEPELVAGLREDLDLRALLPDGAVSEGDSWTVDAAELADLLAPGGQLALRFGYEPDGDFELLALEELTAASLASLGDQAGELEGELEAEWTATEGEEGARTATITLDLEATIEVENSGALERRLELSEIETNRSELRMHTVWTLEGRGRLLWDLDAGVFREFELELDFDAEATVTWTEEFGRHELYHGLELALEGETMLSADCR